MVYALLEPVASLAKSVRASYKTAKWINAKHGKPILCLPQ